MTDIRLPLKRQDHTVYDVTGGDFCYCPGISVEDSHDRAAFIVTACNNYQDLLDACEIQLRVLDHLVNDILTPEQLIHDARIAAISAIAQTEEAQ